MDNLVNPYPTEYFPQPLPAVVEQKRSKNSPDRVKFFGTSWLVRIDKNSPQASLSAGETILIYGRQGLHLLTSVPANHRR